MTTNDTELKPCPFCGRELVHNLVTESELVACHAVWCLECDICGPAGETKEEARRLWNERKELRELQEKLAVAESAMDEALGNIQAGCLFYPPPQSLPRDTIIEIGLRLKKALEDIRHGQ